MGILEVMALVFLKVLYQMNKQVDDKLFKA